MKNGVPWDVAAELDDDERLAYSVIIGRFEGNEFDWRTGRWVEKNRGA